MTQTSWNDWLTPERKHAALNCPADRNDTEIPDPSGRVEAEEVRRRAGDDGDAVGGGEENHGTTCEPHYEKDQDPPYNGT